MNELQYLMTAYKELLKIENTSLRVDLQTTYCHLLNTIASYTNQPHQTIQEWFEGRAINEKLAAEEQNRLAFKMSANNQG